MSSTVSPNGMTPARPIPATRTRVRVGAVAAGVGAYGVIGSRAGRVEARSSPPLGAAAVAAARRGYAGAAVGPFWLPAAVVRLTPTGGWRVPRGWIAPGAREHASGRLLDAAAAEEEDRARGLAPE